MELLLKEMLSEFEGIKNPGNLPGPLQIASGE
jgi:hypothetical protein